MIVRSGMRTRKELVCRTTVASYEICGFVSDNLVLSVHQKPFTTKEYQPQ